MSRSIAGRRPVIAVPVRNEADRLPTLLNALAEQTWVATAHRPLRVVLVLNNCTDHTARVAAAFDDANFNLLLDIVEIDFPACNAHVGYARRLAMDRAFAAGGASSLLLTTDADASPCRNWIDANLRAVLSGADLVGGHIVGDPEEEALLGPAFNRRAGRQMRYNGLVDRLTALLDPLAYDPWPRHSDHTGASLAVKGEVYQKLGGIPLLPCREDVAFVENARQAGFQLRHPLDVRVQVSARLDGRAKGGMADCIQGWLRAEQLGLPHLVEDPASVLHRLEQRSRDAIVVPHRLDDTARPNTKHTLSVKSPDTDVDTAIACLEHLIAANGMR